MAIIVNLDMMLAKRKITSLELANRIGLTPANLSILKTGKAKAVRMSTMDAICREMECQPGDLFEFVVCLVFCGCVVVQTLSCHFISPLVSP